jgi:hypothetical protein
LFDQDTTPTREYLDELLKQIDALTADPGTVVIVPKLNDGRNICSPCEMPTWSHKQIPAEQSGRSNSVLLGFNSGAVLRVESIREIGGFPGEFWLDYLDHATFSELQKNGGRLHVMKSVLKHELAVSTNMRYKNFLDAEHTYYSRYGTVKDRFYCRFRLLKTTLKLLKDRQAHFAYLTISSAFRLI